ncbi:MAG: hypothetical protein ACRDLP_08550 [Solirubrobacteraceae bacterium]
MAHRIHATWPTRSPRVRLLAAAALVSGIVVAGCGGSSHGPSVATVGSTTTSTSTAASTGTGTTPHSHSATTSRSSTTAGGGAASSNPPSQASLDSQALAYSRCMRANGVPAFPDPKAGGGFEFQRSAELDPSSPVFIAAQAKCKTLSPLSGIAPGTQTHPTSQALAQMVKVAECMRRHGVYNFPDPRTSIPSNPQAVLGGAGVISDIDGVVLVFPGTIDEQSPLFTRSAAACKFPLHNH